MWRSTFLFLNFLFLVSTAVAEHGGNSSSFGRMYGDVYNGSSLYGSPSVCGPRQPIGVSSFSGPGAGSNVIPQPMPVAPNPTSNPEPKGPLALGLSAKAGALAKGGDAKKGSALFEGACMKCHKNPELPSPKGDRGVESLAKGSMPKPPTTLTDAEKKDLAAYLHETGPVF